MRRLAPTTAVGVHAHAAGDKGTVIWERGIRLLVAVDIAEVVKYPAVVAYEVLYLADSSGCLLVLWNVADLDRDAEGLLHRVYYPASGWGRLVCFIVFGEALSYRSVVQGVGAVIDEGDGVVCRRKLYGRASQSR